MKYHLTYEFHFHPEGIEKEDVPEGHGACDAMLMASLLHEDGSLGIAFISRDGRAEKSLDDNEIWKVWTMLAASLGDSPTLSVAKRSVCRGVHDLVAGAVLEARRKGARS